MKLLKRIFYGICILMIALCAGIMLCAFNPALTQQIARTLYGEDGHSGLVGQPDMGTLESPLEPGDLTELIKPSGETEAADTGYVAPGDEGIKLPEAVSGKTGYEPVHEEGQEISDEDAVTKETGDIGENLQFSALYYPYYAMLDNDQKELYRQIYANALILTDRFAPVKTASVEQIKTVFEAVYNDHPELFWLDTDYACKYVSSGKCVEVSLHYNKTAQNLEAEKRVFEAAARTILDGAKERKSLYEKEAYVHDALVAGVEYDAGASMHQSAYSALVNGRSVCAGYARAFQYLLQQLEIPCYYCTGYSGENHAWNIVKLGDDYYNVDVTWDDTAEANYDFFNKSDSEYATTHVRKGLSVYLPACVKAGSQSAESGSSVLVNPDPQKPLTLDSVKPESGKEDPEKTILDQLGIREDELLDTMEKYYADCERQMIAAGSGIKQFSNVIPAVMWERVERAYSEGSYEEGYVQKALEKLGMSHFMMQLQAEKINGSYYRLYHNISTWN